MSLDHRASVSQAMLEAGVNPFVIAIKCLVKKIKLTKILIDCVS